MNDTIVFYIISSASSAFLVFMAILYKSKCTDINLCYGCVHIDRNVELEEKFDEIELQHGRNNNNTQV